MGDKVGRDDHRPLGRGLGDGEDLGCFFVFLFFSPSKLSGSHVGFWAEERPDLEALAAESSRDGKEGEGESAAVPRAHEVVGRLDQVERSDPRCNMKSESQNFPVEGTEAEGGERKDLGDPQIWGSTSPFHSVHAQSP